MGSCRFIEVFATFLTQPKIHAYKESGADKRGFIRMLTLCHDRSQRRVVLSVSFFFHDWLDTIWKFVYEILAPYNTVNSA